MRYLKEKLREASSAIRHIARRNLTMMQCAQSIVQLQESFFRGRTQRAAPFKPERCGGAYGRCGVYCLPRSAGEIFFAVNGGLFPLRLLIQRASVSVISGEEVGSDTIRKRISEIVSGEDKAKPLSDQKITERLCGEGYLISEEQSQNTESSFRSCPQPSEAAMKLAALPSPAAAADTPRRIASTSDGPPKPPALDTTRTQSTELLNTDCTTPGRSSLSGVIVSTPRFRRIPNNVAAKYRNQLRPRSPYHASSQISEIVGNLQMELLSGRLSVHSIPARTQNIRF